MEPALKSGSILLWERACSRMGFGTQHKVDCQIGIREQVGSPHRRSHFCFGKTSMKRLLGLCALLSLLAGCASTDTVDPHGYDKTGVASYYGAKHQGKRTASGERFDKNSLTAAHRQLPFGTRVKVTNLNNNRSCVVRINDRGPHTRGRLIDLSHEAAERLGMLKNGTARVRVQALD
jgi:rare lipoprotein A